MEALPWSARAACKGRVDLFYAPRAERPQARERREDAARRVCATCPVNLPCREQGRAHGEQGMWGGESEAERIAAGFVPTSAPTLVVRRPSA